MEKILLQGLATSQFRMRALEGDDVGTIICGPYNAKSKIVQAQSEIENTLMLHIPLSKTFPAVDGVLVVPGDRRIIYAQSTVSTAHPIKHKHMKELRDYLGRRTAFQGFTHILLFIVSDDIFDQFTRQRYNFGWLD